MARTVWRDRVYPYPRKLLTSLGDKNKQLFLSHVQAMAPELYEEWKHSFEWNNYHGPDYDWYHERDRHHGHHRSRGYVV